MRIQVKFHNHPTIDLAVDDTETGRCYFELTRRQTLEPFYRDSSMYTPEFMQELALQAREAFGWNWIADSYDISVTAQLHKDLEQYIGQLGFDQIPEKYDLLLYDLHHCLHAIQHGPTGRNRNDNLQIEWLTDDAVPLPKSFEFQAESRPGDLILINPYVGHNPGQIYLENDFGNLESTCRFHDVIKPGIVMTTQCRLDKQLVLEQFQQHDPEFVDRHGADTIRYYTGSAVIGHVVDVDQFWAVKCSAAELVLEKVTFHD